MFYKVGRLHIYVLQRREGAGMRRSNLGGATICPHPHRVHLQQFFFLHNKVREVGRGGGAILCYL